MRGLLMLSAMIVGGVLAADAAEPAGKTVLGTESYWRYFIACKTEQVRDKSGELRALDSKPGKEVAVVASALPPSDWAAPAFDDSSWARMKGPIPAGAGGQALLCLRGRFEVKDPAGAGSLALSLEVLGGAIAYVNGKEVARVGMPAGKVALDAPAEDYPEEAYLNPEGFLYRNVDGDQRQYRDRLRSRVRELRGVAVPASALVKGVNVLAVEIHRAPASELLLTKKTADAARESWRGRGHYWWSRMGFQSLSLTGAAGSPAVSANIGVPSGLRVWNHPVCREIAVGEHGEATAAVPAVKLSGPRNSVLAGELAVGSDAAIRSLKVAAGALTRTSGGAGLPAAAISVAYLLPDRPMTPRGSAAVFDTLAPTPPEEIAAASGFKCAIQPVWISVRVPENAGPGAYTGKLTISAEGSAPIEVPLALTVHDWALPDPRTFATHVGLIQSPESVAMQYKAEMWSDRHWKLMEKSLELMGQVGCDYVWIPAMRRTHFGNEHGMIRWVRKDGGGYTHDFSLVEKYLDLAAKHLGRPEVIAFYCWEAFVDSPGYGDKDPEKKGMPFSILDPKTGKLEEGVGPRPGTPEAREFLKPALEGLRGILKKRGLEKAMMIGVSTDAQPTKAFVEDLKAIAPDLPWISRGHVLPGQLHGQPVGYACDVWAAPVAPDPAVKRVYGWRNPWLRGNFPRAGCNTVGAMRPFAPLGMWYISLEGMIAADVRGFGSMGADFWDVMSKDDKPNDYGGGWIRNIIGRYPESAYGQVYMGNSSPYVLAAGPDGALPTARFEMIRASAQLCEARIFVEKALLDPEKKAKLGAELAERAQKLLDERTRAVLWARDNGWLWLYSSGWQERDDRLYALCAEVAGRLGK